MGKQRDWVKVLEPIHQLNLNIYEAITIIGLTTFVLSIIAVAVGNFFGSKYKKKAEIVGGIILILIGLKILLEHLGILAF